MNVDRSMLDTGRLVAEVMLCYLADLIYFDSAVIVEGSEVAASVA